VRELTGVEAEAVVIGASAGALEALSAILPTLPANYKLPVIIVVHVPPDKKSLLAELFQAKCSIEVREAEDKEPIRGGTAYFAPPDYHLLVETDKSLSLSDDEPVFYSRPSIDVLFESAADAYGPSLIGIVLTGANRDGADGLKAIVEAGGMAIVQSPKEAYASAMPEAAIAECPGARVLTLKEIAVYLREVEKA
jgi:two-component system, chemotaxis family, protein-glutamate methylesterase/glutaminase